MRLNSKKTIFTKLYPYYCRKLLKKLPLVIVNLLITIAAGIYFFYQNSNSANSKFSFSDFVGNLSLIGLNNFLKIVFLFSLGSIALIYITGSILTTGLVGGYMGGKIKFGLTKESSRGEDIKTLLFTPRITRKEVIWAKFAAVFTYCCLLSFIFGTLPLFVYFAAATKISLIYLLFFLIFNSLINLTLIFLLLPIFFYVNASGSLFLFFVFSILYSVLIVLSFVFFWDFILRNLLFVSIPFMLVSWLVGYLFYHLWKKDFLQKDLV